MSVTTSTAPVVGRKVIATNGRKGVVSEVITGHCSKRLVVRVVFAGTRHHGSFFADETTQI